MRTRLTVVHRKLRHLSAQIRTLNLLQHLMSALLSCFPSSNISRLVTGRPVRRRHTFATRPPFHPQRAGERGPLRSASATRQSAATRNARRARGLAGGRPLPRNRRKRIGRQAASQDGARRDVTDQLGPRQTSKADRRLQPRYRAPPPVRRHVGNRLAVPAQRHQVRPEDEQGRDAGTRRHGHRSTKAAAQCTVSAPLVTHPANMSRRGSGPLQAAFLAAGSQSRSRTGANELQPSGWRPLRSRRITAQRTTIRAWDARNAAKSDATCTIQGGSVECDAVV